MRIFLIKKMPTFPQHKKFVLSKPYSKWYVIYQNSIKIGSIYLSKEDEIGIFLLKKYRGTALVPILQFEPASAIMNTLCSDM